MPPTSRPETAPDLPAVIELLRQALDGMLPFGFLQTVLDRMEQQP
jgi:hypothetical protein